MPRRKLKEIPNDCEYGCSYGWLPGPELIRCQCGTAKEFTEEDIKRIEQDLEAIFGHGEIP